MLKILILSPDFPPPFEGGSLVYMYNIAKSLTVISQNNQHILKNITILTSPANSHSNEDVPLEFPNAHLHKNISITRSKFLTKSFNPSRAELAIMYAYLFFYITKAFLLKQYNMIFTSAGVVGNSIAIFISQIFKIPAVNFTYAEEITIPLSSRGTKNTLKKFFLKKIYPLSTHIITVCKFTKRVINQQLNIPENKITVIPPIVESQKYKSNLNLQKKNQVLSVGRLVKRKGFHNLIEAFRLVIKEIPDATLIIVGRGPEEPYLRHLIDKYQLHNNVILKGNLLDSELVVEYAISKCFVLANITLPNGDTEGCPTVILEAMAHGLPVIAGIAGGTSDAVIDGETGYLVNANDTTQLAEKIKIILKNKDIADKLTNAGKIKTETEHTLSKTTEKILSMLHTLTKKQ